MRIHLKILAGALIVILAFLFYANFGIKRLIVAPQKQLVEQIQGEQNNTAVQAFITQITRNREKYMQQLIVVGIISIVFLMVLFQAGVLNRLGILHKRLKSVRNGETPELPPELGNDDISLLGQEINSLVKRVGDLERDLAFRKACFQAFVADHSELVCRISTSGIITFVNDCFCEFFGKKERQLIGTDFLDLLTDSGRDVMQKHVNSASDADRFNCDVQAVDKHDRPKQLHWEWHVIGKEGDEFVNIQGTGRDISREWKTIQTLDRENKVDHILLTISTKLINLPTAQVDSGIRDVLKGVGELLGADNGYIYRFREHELTATHLWRKDENVIPRLQGVSISLDELSWSRQRFKDGEILLIQNAADLPEAADNERYLMKQAGVMSLIAIPLNYDGMLTGVLFFDFAEAEQLFDDDMRVFLGITGELIGNALERKESMQVLEGGQQRMRTILSAVQTGIFVTNLRTREIVDVNDRACDMVNLPREELLGSVCLRVFDSLPALPGNPHEGITWNVEDTLKDSDGNRLSVLRTTVTIMMQNELHLVESVVDLSNQKRLQSQHMQNERLQGVLEMAGAACHELNQPLQVISGYIDLLMMKIPPDDQNYDKVKMIAEQIKRLGDITGKINNITTYETQDYLSGRIIDIEKSGASVGNEPFGLPANRVNELLAVLRKQKENKATDD